MKWPLVIVVLAVAAGCKFGSSGPFPADGKIDDLEIRLARTECYGPCPVYELTVSKDGTVNFIGESHTAQKSGTWKIGPEEIARLVDEFNRVKYFELEDYYSPANCPDSVTDASTATTSIRINGRLKTVSHYLGCSSKDRDHKPYPPGLTGLENAIDEITGSKRWIDKKPDESSNR